jgi:MoaD family protein
MTVLIEIPSMLYPECDGQSEVQVNASTVRTALEQLELHYPRLHRSICDETGAVRRHVNLFVNTSLVRGEKGLDTKLAQGDVVAVMPAVSGG